MLVRPLEHPNGLIYVHSTFSLRARSRTFTALARGLMNVQVKGGLEFVTAASMKSLKSVQSPVRSAGKVTVHLLEPFPSSLPMTFVVVFPLSSFTLFYE